LGVPISKIVVGAHTGPHRLSFIHSSANSVHFLQLFSLSSSEELILTEVFRRSGTQHGIDDCTQLWPSSANISKSCR